MNSRVFVSQDNGHDYRAAEQHGEVVILSTREIVPWQGSAQNALTIHGIESSIAKDYIAGRDFLLPIGGPLAIAHMFSAAFRQIGPHNILKWDRLSQTYLPYKLQR